MKPEIELPWPINVPTILFFSISTAKKWLYECFFLTFGTNVFYFLIYF